MQAAGLGGVCGRNATLAERENETAGPWRGLISGVGGGFRLTWVGGPPIMGLAALGRFLAVTAASNGP
jgi:hypothetical protein